MSSDGDMLGHYSSALDEIYMQRVVMADAARKVERLMYYSGFPKSERDVTENLVAALKAAAGGTVSNAHFREASKDNPLQWAGAKETLTRAQWEESLP